MAACFGLGTAAAFLFFPFLRDLIEYGAYYFLAWAFRARGMKAEPIMLAIAA